MYPPARRARGISYVLFGSVFGAVLGPTLFGPLFAGKDVAADTLTIPWLAAAGLSLVTCGLALTVRPDTKVIAERISAGSAVPHDSVAAPLREIIRRPGVLPAMLAAIASFGVMVSVMNLTGFVVVNHDHHSQQSVFVIIGAHVLGMYAFVLVIGTLIDRIGRGPALAGGLFLMAVSCAGLIWADSVPFTALLLLTIVTESMPNLASSDKVRKPCAIGAPNGPAFARSTSTWIHWWSLVASAKSWIRSCVTSIQSLSAMCSPTRGWRSASLANVRIQFTQTMIGSHCSRSRSKRTEDTSHSVRPWAARWT